MTSAAPQGVSHTQEGCAWCTMAPQVGACRTEACDAVTTERGRGMRAGMPVVAPALVVPDAALLLRN